MFHLFHSTILILLGYLSFLNLVIIAILIILSLRKSRHYPPWHPSACILIPVYNEQANITRCLNSVFSSDYPISKYEVICIDDGSTDRTGEIIHRYTRSHPNLKLIRSPHLGKAAALNQGLYQAKSQFVITLDADMAISQGFLKEIVTPLQDPKISYSFGPILILNPTLKQPLTYFQSLEYHYMNLVRIATNQTLGYPLWYSGQAVCYPRTLVTQLKGFDADVLIEDFDFSLKLFPQGHRGAYVSDAVSYCQPLTNLRNLIRQKMRWYYGGLQGIIKYRRHFRLRSPVLLFVLFSYFLWFFNSLVMLPTFLFPLIHQAISQPLYALANILVNATALGLLGSLPLIASGHGPYLYQLIGLLLLILFFFSPLYTRHSSTPAILLTIFTYFLYIYFLQACLIFSLVKYTLNQKLSRGAFSHHYLQ